MKPLKLMVMMAGVALGSAACDDGPAPAPPAAPPKPPPAAAAAQKPVEAPAAPPPYVYNYNPVGKRDPFRSPLPEGAMSGPVATVGPCSEPLCQFDVDQLKLVAVVTGDANPMAMVEDPRGRGHLVRRHTRMGRQGGKVTHILRDSITVTEYLPAGGKLIPNAVSLELRKDAQAEAPFDLMHSKNWGE